MMINKRLIGTVSESKKYVAGNVVLQWCSLTANIAMMTTITSLLASLWAKTADKDSRQRQYSYNCSSGGYCRYYSFCVYGWCEPYGVFILQSGKENFTRKDL